MKNEDVGKKIKQLRISKDLTQAELGRQLGVTYQAISNWENGRNTPDLQTVIKIAEIYKISVDELLLLADPYEGEYEPKHWGVRFLLFPILLLPLSFCISQFYLFSNTLMSMNALALFIDMILVLLIGFVKIKFRKNFYLLLTLLLVVVVLATSLPFVHYFNLTEIPYLHEVNQIESTYQIQNTRPESLDFKYLNRNIAIMYNPEYPDIYWFDINNDLEEMETVISTSNKPVLDVEKVGDKLYFTSYQYVNQDFSGDFELYSVNLTDFTITLVLSDTKPYKLFSKNDTLYLYSLQKTIMYENSSIYKLEGNNIALIQALDVRIVDAYYSNDEFTLSVNLPDSLNNVYTYNDLLEYQYKYFENDDQETFYLKKEETKLLTTYNGELVQLYGNIQPTGYMAEIENIHVVRSGFYIDSGTLLDSNFIELSMHSFYLENWRSGDGQFIFSTSPYDKYICLGGSTLYQLERVSRQVDQPLISNNIVRNILLFSSLPFISLIVTSGVGKIKRS